MDLSSYLSDLNIIKEYYEDLTENAIFVAGISLARSKSSLSEILEILKEAQEAFNQDKLSNTNKSVIEFKLYQGLVDEAKRLLKTKLTKSSPAEPEINGKPEKAAKPWEADRNSSKSSFLPTKTPQESLKPEKKAESRTEELSSPPKGKKLSAEDLRSTEQKAFEVLGILRRIDEKEALLQRRLEEQKRAEAEKAAKELKDKLEREYQEKLLHQLEEQKRQEQQAIRCVSCKEKVADKDLCMLEKCSDFFHKKCLKDQIVKDLDSKAIPIKCKSCKTELTIVEINSYLTKRQSQLYSDLTFKAFMHSEDSVFSSCPTVGCRNMFEYEPGNDDYECKVCNRSYCLNCRRASHAGYTCDEVLNYARPNYIVGMGVGQKFKSCIMCGLWVEKTDSILLRCTCGTNFCYTCGSYQGCKCE